MIINRRNFAIACGSLLASACRRLIPQSVPSTIGLRSLRADLVFITRDGCVNTPDMLINLDDALRDLGIALDYPVVNLGKLPKSDPRTGYPTPTILYQNHDLFGIPEPTPPFPEPA